MRHQNRQGHQNRREQRRQEQGRQKHGKKFPDLVLERPNEFEAHLEREMNRVRFGPFQPRNEAQSRLQQLIETKRITFAIGPAGTGKTFVSTSIGCELLEAGLIERLVITRPMVGCEEEMGFLPGTEEEKYAPWLGPFLDVLEGKLGVKKVETYKKFGKIVARPLMQMRGSTFRDSFVILDEAQNTTEGQMKMFLTRVGQGTRVVINGDIEQNDLPAGKRSGLEDAMNLLKQSASIGKFEFDVDDIERDPLVREVVLAYRSKRVI